MGDLEGGHGHQGQSMVIKGNQWSSIVINSHQWSSMVITSALSALSSSSLASPSATVARSRSKASAVSSASRRAPRSGRSVARGLRGYPTEIHVERLRPARAGSRRSVSDSLTASRTALLTERR